jgi:hypothetical protein
MRHNARAIGWGLQAVLVLLGLLASGPLPAADEVAFLRGDVNQDGRPSISDVLMARRWLFNGDREPACLNATDVNDDGLLDMTDYIYLLSAMVFTGDPPLPLAPFPEVGPDPTPETDAGCGSYAPVPAEGTDDSVRIGEVEASPGQTVWIPIFFTNEVAVEAFQLYMTYDPAVLSFTESFMTDDELGFDFDGTIYETLYPDRSAEGWPENAAFPVDHCPDFCFMTPNHGEGLLNVAIVGNLLKEGFEVPPGTDTLVCKVKATVSPTAPPGTYTLDLTNGPDGAGNVPPFYLLNELTHRGDAKYVSVLPKRIPGKVGIVDDVTVFIRGDSNGDSAVDITDPIHLLLFLYMGGEVPWCADAADADDSGDLDLSDAVLVLTTLFLGYEGTGGIAAPYPLADRDPTSDDLQPCSNGQS